MAKNKTPEDGVSDITRKITGQMCVEALKAVGKALPAKELADFITRTDSRAVATALRKPVDDGRVKIMYKRGLGFGAHYKFVRMKGAK
jgi:hypothetical protein